MQALSLRVVGECFGPDVQAVCSALVEFGASTLAELVDAVSASYGTSSPKSGETYGAQSVMDALAQGLQHRIVSYSRAEPVASHNGGRPRPGTVRYEFVSSEALKLLSIPRLAKHAATGFGDWGEQIVTTLAVLGPCAQPDLVEASGVPSEDVGQLLATAQRMHDRGYLEYTKALQSSELSSALAPSALELGSLSQVNFPRFQADFRIAALVTFASEKYDEKSGAVVHAILANGWAVGQAPGVEVSRALSVAQITSSDHVSRVGLKIEAVHRILLALSADPIPFASLSSSSNRVEDLEFVINVGRASEAMKFRAATGFIQHKFGRYHARIIRLLLDKKCLDEKTIGDTLMIPGKDVRAHLFKLYENRLIRMHELCSKADFSSQSTQYTWWLDPESLLSEIKRIIAVTIINLQVRASEEKREASKGASWRGRDDAAATRFDQFPVMNADDKFVATQQLHRWKSCCACFCIGDACLEKMSYRPPDQIRNFYALHETK